MPTERVSNRSRQLAIACALALAPGLVAAQQDPTATGAGELEEIIVTGSQVRLPEPFAGGQVARGGRVGILGNLFLALNSPGYPCRMFAAVDEAVAWLAQWR